MSNEDSGAARDQLFWTLSEHSNADTERLRHLTNTVNESTALALYQSSLRALACDDCSSAIESMVAELERASAPKVEACNAGVEVEGNTGNHTYPAQLHAAVSLEEATVTPVPQHQQCPGPHDQHRTMLEMQQAPPRARMDMLSNAPRHSVDYNHAASKPPGGTAFLSHGAGNFKQSHNGISTSHTETAPAAVRHTAPAGSHSVASLQSLSREESVRSDARARRSSSPGVSKFAELTLRAAGAAAGEQPGHQFSPAHRSPHTVSPHAKGFSQAGVTPQDALHAMNIGSVPQQSAPPHMQPHTSSPLLHHPYPERRFPTPPRPQQSPPTPQALPRPLAVHLPHSSQPPQRPLMVSGMRQFGDALPAGLPVPDMTGRTSHASISIQRPAHLPLSGAMPQTPSFPQSGAMPQAPSFPQYNTNTLEQMVSSIQNPAQMPYGMPHPTASVSPPMQQQQQQSADMFGAAMSSAANPMQTTHHIQQWCVVTGLPNATLPPAVPPDGVLNITHLLPWPPAVRNMLQRGLMGLTLDPIVRECRGQIDQPAVMLMVAQPGEAGTLLQGVTYQDMFRGRQNLPEAWRMPAQWENDTAEMALEDLDSVRLVLSYGGLNLLPNTFEPFFLCVQSALMVLCNAPGDAYSGTGESEVGKLLWEFMRTSMDCLQRMADSKQQSAQATECRGGSTEPLRGGWLQRLNHEKQKLALMIDWHDRQQPDLTWVSTLLINGKPVNVSEACVKKQDARDSAARMYLISIGIVGHD